MLTPSTVLSVLRIASPRSKIDFLLENKSLLLLLLVYVFTLSVIAICLTVYDKWAAKKRPKHRTPERFLLLVSALGGSVAMLLTMLAIRHKTLHLKFTLGIPLIIAMQIALGAVILFVI